MTSTTSLILGFVFDLACLLFWLRFLLQASRADFYNPLSQAVVKGTDPVCRPLRLLLKPIGTLDLASLLVAWIIGILGIMAIVMFTAPEFVISSYVLVAGTVKAVSVLLQFYFFAIIIMVLASFIAPGNYNPVLALIQQLLEPIMGPIRRVLPPLGPIDLSPMVVFLVIMILQNLLGQIRY